MSQQDIYRQKLIEFLQREYPTEMEDKNTLELAIKLIDASFNLSKFAIIESQSENKIKAVAATTRALIAISLVKD